ncbi:MAG TPA: 7-cyano-7-deazaguanine synthase QueC [Gammaproteobacteria bacterium]|nr:7-cyano-7-deazaguanine synthase QueC [Gammaproteobacteria bacterium]
MTNNKTAIVLLSGGLDSATTLAIAINEGFRCHALSFAYGQRHGAELQAAKTIANALGVTVHKTVKLDLADIGGSALTDFSLQIPESRSEGIPVTYVPARNTIFLSYALAWAEVLQSSDIFIGVNAVDYSGYPDCRPEYIDAFMRMAKLATKSGVEGQEFNIHTPLIDLSKADIIKRGAALGLDYALTISCYQADEQGRACGQCDACYYRKEGFATAGIDDPTRYR